MDGAADEFDLPEPIIQLVQSFLSSKEAARTTIFSKSWRSAWLTRPNLDFDLEDFRPSNYGYHESNSKFRECAERTLRRYENSNLNIHSFKLNTKYVRNQATVIVTKLVRRALKLGPTRLTFEFGDSYGDFDIPDDVFRCENLVSLSAKGCRINQIRDEVCCSRLQFLGFNHVRIESADTIVHILSSCPLIEKLSLDNVNVDVGGEDGILMTIISPLHRLKTLVLKHVNFDTTLFLADLSSKLPSLKDLTLHISKNREEILISSPTLEHLNFHIGEYYGSGYTVQRVKLDIPSIRKLTFACSNVPDELSITSNSRGWESCVSVTHVKCLNASWFYKLSNFIDKFKFSRISLFSLHFYNYISLLDHKAGDVRGLPTPEIENLTILVSYMTIQNCCDLFDGLFQMCRPKVINIRSESTYPTNIINFLAKRLFDAKVPTPRAQFFDAAVSKWRDVTLESLLDEDSKTAKNYRDFRFHLNWKE